MPIEHGHGTVQQLSFSVFPPLMESAVYGVGVWGALGHGPHLVLEYDFL